jgi:hypothetical protein
VWIKNSKGIEPRAMLATAKLSDETTITKVLPNELPWDISLEPHVTFWKREYPENPEKEYKKDLTRSKEIQSINVVIAKALDEDQPMANALYDAGLRLKDT